MDRRGRRGGGAEAGEGLRPRSVIERLPLAVRRLGILACDFGWAAASLPLAFWLRYGDWAPALAAMPPGAPWLFLLVFAVAYRIFGLHRGIWRYTSLADLVVILEVVTVSVVGFALLAFLLYRLEGVPRSLPFLQWGVLLLGLAGPRILYRALREGELGGLFREMLQEKPGCPVLLVGIDSSTPYLLRRLREGPEPVTVVGLLSADGRERRGQHLAGVPVLGRLEELETVVARLERRGLRPVRVILGVRLLPARLEDLLARCRALGLELLRSPDPRELEAAERAPRLRLRPIALEDLLERPEIRFDDAAIRRLLAGRRVLVTGAGSIGRELVRQILRYEPAELVVLDCSELALFELEQEIATSRPKAPLRTILADVRDRRRIHDLFTACRPELVFHTAALKHVPMVEAHPREGVLTNVLGTRHVADAAMACGALGMVLISTDKAVNPTSVMGATKRLAEFYCQMRDLEARRSGRGTRFVTVRFGNVLGSSGSVLTIFRRQLERGGPLTVTHPEITRYFMTIPEAVQLVLHASAWGIEGDAEAGYIFVLDMGRPVRILDLARKLIRLAGFEPERDIPIEITRPRPGEKLYEELFDHQETRAPAPIPGVRLARPRPLDRLRLERALDMLETAARDGVGEAELRAMLARIVPGYRPMATSDEGGPPALEGGLERSESAPGSA